MLTSKLEVLVNLEPKADEAILAKTLKALKATDGVKEAKFKDGAIIVETTLPSSLIIDLVSKSTGTKTVLQGFGETQSAVAMISSQSCHSSTVMGVVRFQQSMEGPLVVDGTIDGLTPGDHGLTVHETGDLSKGCKSIGPIYHRAGVAEGLDQRGLSGALGNILADQDGRATFRIIDNVLNVSDIIGRSVAVTDVPIDTKRSTTNMDDWTSIACGIIARSAGIFQNAKRICACDGVPVWEEANRPLAGRGRRGGGEGESCCH